MSRRTIEIHSLEEFDQQIEFTEELNGWFVQGVDLTDRGEVLKRVNPTGAVFLGCPLTPGLQASLRDRGALLFPRLPDLPFDPYRSTLYDAEVLYGEGRYADSPDAAIYAWSQEAGSANSIDRTLAVALHDHSITDSLNEATDQLPPQQVVGMMGGHALVRGDASFRAAAELGLQLTAAGRTILTGGGPGAMEAANLGGYFAGYPDGLGPALELLAEAATYSPRIDAWIDAARTVREKWPPVGAGHSIGIPTWFYGHEPTNLFATQIAKYFTNALREDTLLSRCQGGIVYLPGAAGTVQEIFQAATENYYPAADSQISPMILVNRRYWTDQLPAWPLLQALAAKRPMARAIHCVDSITEATQILLDSPD